MIFFFYHKWFVYISIAHTIHISIYFFITLFNFFKNVCKEMCTNHDLFFLLVNINLNYNAIFYFLFNRKNTFFKIITKHNFFQHNHFL
jgi:hypothetical protein